VYLTEEAIRKTLLAIAHNVKEFTLSFDYLTEAVIAKTTGDPAITRFAESFAEIGAPWTFGFASIQKFSDEAALKIASNIKMGELHSRVLAGRAFGLGYL